MNNLFEFSDLPLTQLAPTYAQGSIWLEENMDKQVATFDLVIRDMPKNRNYMVYGGLEEIVHYLINLKYTAEKIQLLFNGGLITKKFANYLKKFCFSGDVYAMPEGTIFFPGEPVVRITAPIIEASLIEIALFNITVSNVLFLTKASRIRSLSKNVNLGMQRAHSFESGIKSLRSGQICGLFTRAWPVFVEKYNLSRSKNYIVNGQHFFIKSFSNEITALRKMAQYFPNNASFMIDTYDLKRGLTNAITVGKELKKKESNLCYVTIDAGDLDKLSRIVRKQLDQNGLGKVKIMAATNLDEYKIKELLDRKAPIDLFIVATEYTTVSDSPNLEVVYKVAEIRNGKNVRHTAKLTLGKESYPGRKQVFREFKQGKFVRDTIGLENENYGEPLLKKIMHKGKLINKLPSLNKIQKYFDKQLLTVPEKLLSIEKEYKHSVKISKKLKTLLLQVKQKHLKNY